MCIRDSPQPAPGFVIWTRFSFDLANARGLNFSSQIPAYHLNLIYNCPELS
jgi:hypothetical protein